MMAGRISFNMTCLLYFSSLRAKRSNPWNERKTGLLRRFAPRNDGLGEMQGGDDEVDGLDADKRNDDAADAVDHQVALQQRPCADRPIPDALERERNERN